jgi:MYXO-CTERM domain-containing protein
VSRVITAEVEVIDVFTAAGLTVQGTLGLLLVGALGVLRRRRRHA